ncbi:MAG: hypothetical protein Q4G51_16425 [Dermatophilus congolensis]|nr:hypothetical protein [Dermatophilus congolensis]
MNDNVTWLQPTLTETQPTDADAETNDMSDMHGISEPTETTQITTTGSTAQRPPVRHGQVILGVAAIVAAAAVVLNLTTSVFSHPLATPLVVLGLGVFVLVYGLVALRAGRPLSPGEEERRERQALTRITKQEQRRARRAARRS